mgnify:CR=1 FL=1|jgi:hypothetical protein
MRTAHVFRNVSGQLILFAALTLVGSMNVSVDGQENQRVFIRNGKPVGIHDVDGKWKQRDAVLEGQGERVYLYADRMIAAGDFTISARLRMQNQLKSAAGFVLGDSFFGFEGAKGEEIFLNGPLFGGYQNVKPSRLAFERGAWIDFEVQRRNGVMKFLVDGKTLHELRHEGPLGQVGFTPWRSTMQIQHFAATGTLVKRPSPRSRGYSIPTLDLAAEKNRQVIVDREEGQYLGHVTTVLLEDNRTMIAVYPKGHGRGAIVMKRSVDGGKTWSQRLSVPGNWSTSKEVPTIHRVIDRRGVKRLILFSGLYPVRMAVSEDDGKHWSPLKKIGDFGGIVTMGCVARLANGDYMALFHDDGRFFKNSGKPGRFVVYKTVSSDGGLTWSPPSVVATHAHAHLCEPGILRSPDGRQLAVLLRENSRRLNSFLVVSNDEGRTWSQPIQLPASLTGDRHTGVYSSDGRLFISFRDTTHVSSTKGDWVAWVGTYEDLIKGREGQYRVRLMDNHKGGDCAYPGVEILPDDTIVTTTYGHWVAGKQPYIVSVRLKLAELDLKWSRQQKEPALQENE